MTRTMNPTIASDGARTGTVSAAVGLGRRSVINLTRLPSAFLPSVAMPIFQAVAFSGTFFAIIRIPGFPTDRSINWYLPLAVIMGCGFAGIGLGFAMIRDLENGFYDRLRMTPVSRWSLILGPLLSALVRAVLVTTIVLLVGFIAGARLTHGPIGLLPLYISGVGMAVIGSGWSLGLAYRFRDMRAAAIMQLTFFLALFLSNAQTPLFIIEGWLEPVARINPFTNVLRLARLGFLDPDITWNDTWGGLLALAVLSGCALVFARTGLEKLDDG